MNLYLKLQKLERKLFFTTQDIADEFGLRLASACVLSSRYTKKGIFIRLKRNLYVLSQKWNSLSKDNFFKISNFLQVPSYISFMSALSFYGVTTQIQRNFFESASIKRSARFDIKGTNFNFYKLKKSYYFGFIKQDNFFIATKEKAFVDALYLYSFGKYRLDFASLDLGKLDKHKVLKIIKVFPKRTQQIIRQRCRI